MAIFNERLVEVAEKYLRKGSKVYLEGQLETRKWTDQSGAEKYTTEVVLRQFRGELTMLDGRQGGGGGMGAGPDGGPEEFEAGSGGGNGGGSRRARRAASTTTFRSGRATLKHSRSGPFPEAGQSEARPRSLAAARPLAGPPAITKS